MASSGMLRRMALVRTDMLVTANIVPSLPILVTVMIEALLSSETSVFVKATRRNIPEDSMLIVPAVKTSNITCFLFHYYFAAVNIIINIITPAITQVYIIIIITFVFIIFVMNTYHVNSFSFYTSFCVCLFSTRANFVIDFLALKLTRKEELDWIIVTYWGTRLCSWLRRYATSRKVACSILDKGRMIISQRNPSSHTAALR
jgi:hypothetical protein